MNPGLWSWLGWFVFGIAIGSAGTIYFYSLKDKGVTPLWYEWLLAALTVFLAGFAFQNFFGSFSEMEPQAAWLSLLLIGFPVVVLGVVVWRLISRRVALPAKKP